MLTTLIIHSFLLAARDFIGYKMVYVGASHHNRFVRANAGLVNF